MTGTITLLDAIRRQGSRIPFVYASSAAAYGDTESVPTKESDPRAPLSAYGADKLACELHARVASHVHGIPATGLRFFNVYGPRQDPKSPYSGVISIFAERISAGRPVAIYGDGKQTRDFIYVGDVVRALLAAMALCPVDAPVFNVCTGVATSVRDLACLIAELSGQALHASHQAARAGEIRHSRGAPDLAETVLRLPSPLPLRDGLAKMLTWLGDPRE